MPFYLRAAACCLFFVFSFSSSLAAQVPNVDPLATPPLVGSGSYRTVMEMDPGLPRFTIYRPDDLSAMGNATLPIVVWGNGGCANTGNLYPGFLTEISSYGYLVISLGPMRQVRFASPARIALAPPYPVGPPPNLPPPATHPAQMIEAINWAIAENQRIGSRYYGRLDSKKIAVMGHSCGGVQAIEVAVDPRIITAVIWDSGLFPKPTDMAGGKAMGKDDLKSLHTPVAYIGGDARALEFVDANDDFDKITSIPVFLAYERGVTHGGTYQQPNGGEFGGVAVAWLSWQLKGDQRASLMFRGHDCGLCVNPRWVVRKKKID